jgi:multiple sugar transport system substrate-binding protein
VGREGEVAAELIKDFLVEHPRIDVEVQKLPWTAAHEKLLTAYAGDTLPDLCQLGNTWVPEFAALNALQPLDSFVKESTVVTRDDYFAGFIDSNRVDGALYGVPWYVDTRLMYYRTDLLRQAGFASPPRTWDEWVQMLVAIKAMVGPERYSILLPLNEFEPLLVLALQMPEPVLRDEGRWGNFRSADFRRALGFYAEMFERAWAPRMTNTQISNVWDEFGHGYFSFYISGPWNIAEFKRRLPADLQDDWMTAPMPGPSGPGVSSAGGASLVVFRSSQFKQEAWQLAEYLSRPEIQQRFYQLTGNMPPRRSTWTMPELAQSAYARAFHQQLDHVRSPPKVPEWERIATEMRLAAERVVQHASSIDEAVVGLDRKVDAILEKRRWMLDRRRSA